MPTASFTACRTSGAGNSSPCEHLLFLTDAGVLIVARRTAEGFTEESRLEISQSPTWSIPVFLHDGILVRSLTSVQKLSWP